MVVGGGGGGGVECPRGRREGGERARISWGCLRVVWGKIKFLFWKILTRFFATKKVPLWDFATKKVPLGIRQELGEPRNA